MSWSRYFVFVALLALPGPAGAADPGDGDKPTLHAVRIQTPIQIDGVLDEAAWDQAIPVTEFTQIYPDEGDPVSERTEARILYDDDALYVGVRLYDSGPITSRLGRRDMPIAGDSDWFGVMLDSDHDHRTAFGFDVNPDGVKRDEVKTINTDDNSWDPVWEVATTVDAEGWTAEYRIPFSQLRFSGEGRQTWGIQLERLIARKGEYSVSTFIPRKKQGGVPEYGHLAGLEGIGAGKRLELLPYTLTRTDNAEAGDPGYGAAVGLDLQYRVTSELTLSATLNPDFGQVELDPAVVNLSAFETFYEEKRPFFVEDAGIFDFAGSAVGPGRQSRNLFYSRRIGRRPQLPVEGGAPDATTILGAAKLTGRTADGWSVGVLEAATQAEWVPAATDDAAEEALAEPFTNYFATRLSRELRGGRSALGGIVTAVNRDLATPAAADLLASGAYTGGIDFRHEWAGRSWSVSGFFAASHLQGDTDAIRRVQTSSAHYFQQPDSRHLTLDPEATSLSGYAGQLQIRKQGGRHWRGDAAVFFASPGYEVNDLGYSRRSDVRGGNAQIMYQETEPGRLVRFYSVFAQGAFVENFAGDLVESAVIAGGMWQFQNLWRLNLEGYHFFASLDDRLTRGGVMGARPAIDQVEARLTSDPRKPVTGTASLTVMQTDAGGNSRSAGLTLTFRPTPRWNLSIGPNVKRAHSTAQYVTTVEDETATHTMGARYVFAELDQTTVSLDTRLDVTFTPTLTLELFAQPFLSSVAYGDPRELRAPGTYEFVPYAGAEAVPDPDFNLRSLRGNAVLRWEWRPGSTLYLAWQQQREDVAAGVDDFDFGRDRSALFRTAPDNILMLKVNYWLNF